MDDKNKFTEEQWKLYEYLKKLEFDSEQDEWIHEHFPISKTKYSKCPLCGYETDSTNVHRSCPLAPLLPNSHFVNGEELAIYIKLANVNMVSVKGEGHFNRGLVTRGWKKLQWRRDITPEIWDKIIAEQDFVNAKEEDSM